ncbi:MAG: pyruvate formate-lyase-activating protein [Pleomorphochaeta sp.]|nr:pyruvate formate-lyase-activating protein [Sphaerochaetaceae bacterium]
MGYIHSIETFGTVDGPGIRFVVFLQGCPLRCLYCHNPDSWKKNAGTEMTVDEILNQYERNIDFYKNGGLTATGGEPLFQLDFLTKLFVEAKKRGIHTCLDTSAGCFDENNLEKYDLLLENTDLVLLDIKHSDSKEHQKLTGIPSNKPIEFLKLLDSKNIQVIIRHVLVPTITEDKDHFEKLGEILSPFDNIYGVDVLPYHNMGESKYEQLNIPYPLKGLRNANITEARNARNLIVNSYLKHRLKRRTVEKKLS